MDVNTIKAQIKQQKIGNFYIFTGPEWQGQKIYFEQMSKVSGKKIYRVDSIMEIYRKLRTNSFSESSYIYIARDDKEFMQNEKLQQQLNSLLKNNTYILLLTNVDKRTKFYKKYKNDIVEFEYFKEASLIKYIQKEISLSTDNCKKLIDMCENDYGRILLEIDKIKQYEQYWQTHERKSHVSMNPDNCFIDLIQNGAIYIPPKDAIFDFVEAVMCRSMKCWNLLQQSFEVGEASLVLLSVLYNNVKQTLQVQSCDSKDISKYTGLTGWQIQCAKNHLNKYSNGELVYAMRLIQQVESGIKTGRIEDEFSVPYVLVNML